MNPINSLVQVRKFRLAFVGWIGVMTLMLCAVVSSVQAQETNHATRFPSLAEVLRKWTNQPLTQVEQAFEKGDLTAGHYLGYCYSWGVGLPTNVAKGLQYYGRAGDAGYLPSLNNLGLMYERGEIVTKDLGKALGYYRRAAEKGFARAMRALYMYYRNGMGVTQDDVAARNWLRRAAEAGDAQAQTELGHFSEYPFDWDRSSLNYPISNNIPEAIRWYRLAAAQGYSPGQYQLALSYVRGVGIEQDEERALELMRKSADQDYPYAMWKLAEFYGRGIGEPRGPKDRPIELLRRAAEQIPNDSGAADVAGPISFRYQHGLGADRDLIEAARWYCRGRLAQRIRSSLSDKILSTAQERTTDPFGRALSLYLKAATTSNPDALMKIGQMYLDGRDVPQSVQRAWPWMKLAAQHGAPDSKLNLTKVEIQLTNEQLAQEQGAFSKLETDLKIAANAAQQRDGR